MVTPISRTCILKIEKIEFSNFWPFFRFSKCMSSKVVVPFSLKLCWIELLQSTTVWWKYSVRTYSYTTLHHLWTWSLFRFFHYGISRFLTMFRGEIFWDRKERRSWYYIQFVVPWSSSNQWSFSENSLTIFEDMHFENRKKRPQRLILVSIVVTMFRNFCAAGENFFEVK